MAEEARPERRTTLQFTIPTAPSPPIAGPDAARPSLGQHFHATTNANGQCACWDRFIPALNLLEEPSIPISEVCIYHRAYFSRRIYLQKNHRCDCHYSPDDHRCQDCGYCHACGCDLITTSTEHFHRCSCSFCLTRCCPQEPTNIGAQHILRQHAFLRARQTTNRCSAGTPPSRERHPSPSLTLPEQKTLDQLSPRLPGIGRGRSREETVTGVPLRINNRWPGENGSSVTIEQDRGATGLLKAHKIRTTPRLTPACSSSAAFTGSTSPNPPTCSYAPPETSERPASATDTEASWTVLSASAPSPATTTTKPAPVSEDDDW